MALCSNDARRYCVIGSDALMHLVKYLNRRISTANDMLPNTTSENPIPNISASSLIYESDSAIPIETAIAESQRKIPYSFTSSAFFRLCIHQAVYPHNKTPIGLPETDMTAINIDSQNITLYDVVMGDA